MKRVAKRIIKFLIGKSSHQQLPEQEPVNIIMGENVSYHKPSVTFVTLDKGLIELKDNICIGKNVELGTGGLILVNEGTTIQDRCIILGDIEIGRYCTFAPNVYMSSGRHYYNLKPEYYIRDQDSMIWEDAELVKNHSKKVVVEDDCWLGINVVVMSGVTIGKGSVIGANSVVTKNVEPYSVMTGSPAKLAKKRLDFVLKNELSFSNDADLPNFYSGFLTNLKNLKESRLLGGIEAKENFSVYMNSAEKKVIKVIVKTLGHSVSEIAYNNQTKTVTDNFTELIFDIDNVVYHKFSIVPDNKVGVQNVLIQSIFVQ